MKIHKDLHEVIERMLDDGVKVYGTIWDKKHPDTVITYVHYTDGVRIGYVQKGLLGIEYSTCHVPNEYSGTGFKVESTPSNLFDYTRAFSRPDWAWKFESTPWKDWEEFAVYKAMDFTEVTREDLKDEKSI